MQKELTALLDQFNETLSAVPPEQAAAAASMTEEVNDVTALLLSCLEQVNPNEIMLRQATRIFQSTIQRAVDGCPSIPQDLSDQILSKTGELTGVELAPTALTR